MDICSSDNEKKGKLIKQELAVVKYVTLGIESHRCRTNKVPYSSYNSAITLATTSTWLKTGYLHALLNTLSPCQIRDKKVSLLQNSF